MAENKEIVFKVPEFPHLSETFIIAQILAALELGYKIKIVTKKVIKDNFLISPIIFEHNLLDRIVIEDYKIPKNKLIRLSKWCMILLKNLHNLISIINYHKEFSNFSLTWLYQWKFYIQFNNAAIIHVQYGTNSFPYRVITNTNIFKPTVIVTFHGHDAFFPLYGRIPNNGYYEKLFNKKVLITANTPYLGEKLIALGCSKENLKLVPVGVDTMFFTPGKVDKTEVKTLRLITVGRLDKVKGHQFAIEVVNELIKKRINVSLTIIGEGLERENLENLIKAYSLEEYVFLKGSKSQIQIREELRGHNLFLMLGVPVENERRETQGLVTLEAQACGLPVIAFDSGGIKYTVQEGVTGFVCKEFDIDTVVKKIEFFNQKRNLIKEMGTQATIFVNNQYSQTIINKRWEQIYNSVIN
ncbi:hypothetical protein APS56_05330 [Pseudalgibacter alginicilyticus]|uniref:Glycosyl transferase family 1 domain-containing protein n=1 Tax=Pseudalgibacter alginicilyticus TaxID=1736674 RepID=A0A0P0D7A1_9FLAO|nr:glycosyltransferase [Pseudalgibacter alginicilyticus]ALJ04595.1 hypothetical protein APS56_05330 [Pseudalgibacter alginicilyticus]